MPWLVPVRMVKVGRKPAAAVSRVFDGLQPAVAGSADGVAATPSWSSAATAIVASGLEQPLRGRGVAVLRAHTWLARQRSVMVVREKGARRLLPPLNHPTTVDGGTGVWSACSGGRRADQDRAPASQLSVSLRWRVQPSCCTW